MHLTHTSLLSAFRAALLTLSIAVASQAGLLMVQSYQKLDDGKPASDNKIYIEKDRVRMDMGANPDQFFIYRGDQKLFWMVNLKDKTYMEMTEKDFEAMYAKMDEAMKKMQEQMEKMPPEQKKMMEGMMAKMMPGGANTSKTVYKKVGSGEKVNAWVCDKYEGMRETEKHSEIWTTEPKKLNISEGDMQVLKDMAKFFEKFAKNMEGVFGGSFSGAKDKNGLEGVPVKTLTYKDGKPEFQTEMKEIKKETFAGSLFEVPAGLTKKQMGKPEAK